MNIERLNKLQKCAARIILKADLMASAADMFQNLGWTPVNSRLKYNKALNDQTPVYISNVLKPTTETRYRTLSLSEPRNLTVPRVMLHCVTSHFIVQLQNSGIIYPTQPEWHHS